MNTCSRASDLANSAARFMNESVDSDTKTLLEMVSIADAGDLLPGYLKLGSGDEDDPITKLDRLVEGVSNGVFKTLEDLNSSTDQSKKVIYQQALVTAAEQLYRASNNPSEVLEKAAYSSRIISYLKTVKAASSGRLLLQRIVNAPLRLFGNPESIEFVSNRPTVLREHPVASRIYYMMSKITNFVAGYNNNPMSGVNKLMDLVSNNAILKDNGINREVFNKIFPFFDEQTLVKYGSSAKDKMVESLRVLGVEVDEDRADLVFNELKGLRDNEWHQINYGHDKATFDGLIAKYAQEHGVTENQAAFYVAKEGSILGNHRILSDAVKQLYAEAGGDSSGWENSRHTEAVNEVMNDLNDPVGRIGYVPGNIVEDDVNISSGVKKRLISISNLVEHRTDDSYFTGNGDFYNGVITSIGANGIMFEETARIIGFNAVKKSVEDNPEWFRANADRRVVYHGIKTWLHDQRVIIDSPEEIAAAGTKTIKKLSAMTGLIPAAILMNPGSAINNLLAGHLNMMWAFGNESKMGRYLADAEEGRGVAQLVMDRTKKFMMSPGLTSEFNIFSPPGAERNVINEANNIVQNISDKLGNGIVGFLPGAKDSTFLKNVTTVKGSEGSMRSHGGGLLYNRLVETMGAEGLELLNKTGKLSDEEAKYVNDMIDKIEPTVMYDMMQALGDFSPTSKPFWAHTLGDTAKTAPMALAGAIGKLLYVFRHPMIVTFENYASSVFKNVNTIFSKQIQSEMSPAVREAFKYSIGSGSVGLFMAVWEFMRDAVNADKPATVLSFTETLNPFQLTREGANLFYASIVAPILGSPISEKAYNEIVASNVAFAANLLGGKDIGSAIRQDYSSAEFLKSLTKVMDLPEMVYEMAVNPEITNGNVSKLYEARTQLRNASSGITNIDPLWWVERAFEFSLIKDPQNPDQVNQKFMRDNALTTVASAFGLSVWRTNPDAVKRTRMNYYYSRETTKRSEEFYARTGGRAGRMYNQAAYNQVEALRKYGKIFAPKPPNPIPSMR